MPRISELFEALPRDANEFTNWSWDQIEPFFANLMDRTLDINTVGSWLLDWSQLDALIDETLQRQAVATTRFTADRAIQDRFEQFNQDIYLPAQNMDQRLKQKLLNSCLLYTSDAADE